MMLQGALLLFRPGDGWIPFWAAVASIRDYGAYIHYAFFTGIRRRPNYRQPVRYFFHIFDGPKVFPDESGNSLSSPEIAVQQAKALTRELAMAGALCRSHLVLVLDETGNIICRCWAACSERRSTGGWQVG
jgi:hypothetical protein